MKDYLIIDRIQIKIGSWNCNGNYIQEKIRQVFVNLHYFDAIAWV